MSMSEHARDATRVVRVGGAACARPSTTECRAAPRARKGNQPNEGIGVQK